MNDGVLLLTLSLVFSLGCTPAITPISGGSTTLPGRYDIGMGASARLPISEESTPALSQPRGGASPLAFVRRGFEGGWDLGLFIIPTGARLETRHERELRGGSTRVSFSYGAGGWFNHVQDETSGTSNGGGLLFPFVLGVDIGGLYEAWFGSVSAIEFHSGQSYLRTGAALGLAMGLRWIHFWAELLTEYEWAGSGTPGETDRWVMTPSFGVRFRL